MGKQLGLRILLGWALVWGASDDATAFVRDFSRTTELLFVGGPPGPWRMESRLLDRLAPAMDEWRPAESAAGTRRVQLGASVVLQMTAGTEFPLESIQGLGLRPGRRIHDSLWILRAADVPSAARAAEQLALEPGVEVSVPVMRRAMVLHSPYSRRLNDPYFVEQWHLENRDAEGMPLGPDLSTRSAWPISQGEGIRIAICDNGFETDHPDLAAAAEGGPHYDFVLNRSVASVYGAHATCVTGLAAARGDNGRGIAGVAPRANLASWVIFDAHGMITSDELLMDMFQYQIQEVPIQNHSWGNGDIRLSAPSVLEANALSNAITKGRGGLGVVVVRAAGNWREEGANVNEDGYANDPRVITVGSARSDGRVASYSSPGACILVTAPSGDQFDRVTKTPNLCTTDQVGTLGFNQGVFTDDRADYAYLDTGFTGTSASTPQVAGTVALMLSANPTLTYRDVQQVLLHSARHVDPNDPDVRVNGAGYTLSHNQGFGMVHAGQAAQLAVGWSNRPPLETVTVTTTDTARSVPDAGLRVWIREGGAQERSVLCKAGSGPHPDEPTEVLPFVFVGRATNDLTVDLTGKAALIERGSATFRQKIIRAADAGARFAVVYNNTGGDELYFMEGTDFVPIPAVLISQNAGQELVARLEAGVEVTAQIRLEGLVHSFVVTNTFSCEHVGLRIRAPDARRGDLRITLVSPMGTRSVMQPSNRDTESGPRDWTYWSVHHFYESSAGTWTAYISDQEAGVSAQVQRSELILRGITLQDTDRDGLDDRWELQWFGDLSSGPRDDPDQDGSWNAREQVLGTNPNEPSAVLRVDFAPYDSERLRLSWPSTLYTDFRLLMGSSVQTADTEVARVPGTFPEAEWIWKVERDGQQFFRLEAVPR